MRTTTPLTLAFALALGAGTVAGCSHGGAEEPAAAAHHRAVVRAVPVTDTLVARPILATGTAAPADEAALGFKIGGVIERITVDEGDAVRAGQILASLDLREIDAMLARARSAAAKADRDLERARKLYADSVVALADLQDSETAHEVGRADLETAAVNRRYAVIVAPTAGVVLRREAEPGENIAAGSTVLVVGSRGSRHGQVVKVSLADRDAVSVRRGDTAVARFDALPGRDFGGRVTRVGAAADPATGTYEVEIALDDGGPLAAGLVGRVEIRPSRAARATLIPVEAVLEADGAEATIYTLSSDGGTAERRRVTLAFIDGDQAVVAGGLEGASQVLTDGAAYLDDGAAVRVVP
jgi:RND family efflux transporter MFP subunit